MATATHTIEHNTGFQSDAMVRVLLLAARTADAYSADAFGAVGWTECAAMLIRRGYGDEEAEAILRSKWTRWARDSCAKRRQYGHYRGADLAAYLDKYGGAPGSAKVRDLF